MATLYAPLSTAEQPIRKRGTRFGVISCRSSGWEGNTLFDRLLYVTIQLINIRLYSFPSTHVWICYQLHIITMSIIMHEMDHYNIGNNRPTLGTRHWLEVDDDDVCLSASNRGRTHLRNMMLLYSQQKKGALRFPLLVDI